MPVLFTRLVLLSLALVATAFGAPTRDDDTASLRAQLEELKAKNRQLEARNHTLEATLASQDKAIALAAGEMTPAKAGGTAPGSSLDWDRAIKAATAARYLVPGSKLMTVMPTGSMKPMFDERAVLIMEPAGFETLKVGDIVTFLHPRHKMPVVHRIVEKRGDSFWTKGDGNGRRDDIWITRENYQARVCGVIYAREAVPGTRN